jgi:hypothetical protein
MSFKRARSQINAGFCSGYSDSAASDTRSKLKEGAGKELREFLISRYTAGSHNKETWAATDVCITAYWATEAGAEGVSDMALHPKAAAKHASDHLKLHMTMIVFLLLGRLIFRACLVELSFLAATSWVYRLVLAKEFGDAQTQTARIPIQAKKGVTRQASS